MLQALIFLISSLLIFIIFTETVKFRIIYGEDVSVEIHFTVFALLLSRDTAQDGKQSKSRRKRNRSDSLRKLINFIKRLIPFSEVELTEFELYLQKKEPANDVLRRAGALSLISALLAYADSRAKIFRYNDITVLSSDNTNLKTRIDLSITTSLLRLLTASAVLLKKYGD